MSGTLRREDRRSERRTAQFGIIKAFDDVMGPREFGGTMTIEVVDYMGDIVVAAGADISDFLNRPVLVDSHDTSTAAKIIGTVPSVTVMGNRIDFRAEFLPQGISPLADQICAAVKCGAITDVSIGFLPIEWEYLEGRGAGIRFTKWKLLELSVCPVGANPGAKITQKSFARSHDDRPASAAELADFADELRRIRAEHGLGPQLDPADPAGSREFLRALREQHGLVPEVDPRLAVAEAQFRVRRW